VLSHLEALLPALGEHVCLHGVLRAHSSRSSSSNGRHRCWQDALSSGKVTKLSSRLYLVLLQDSCAVPPQGSHLVGVRNTLSIPRVSI